jgi:hypothetical protein
MAEARTLLTPPFRFQPLALGKRSLLLSEAKLDLPILSTSLLVATISDFRRHENTRIDLHHLFLDRDSPSFELRQIFVVQF